MGLIVWIWGNPVAREGDFLTTLLRLLNASANARK